MGNLIRYTNLKNIILISYIYIKIKIILFMSAQFVSIYFIPYLCIKR